MRVKPEAKSAELFALATPVGMSGSFDDFKVKINPVELTGSAISFVTSPLHVPVRKLFEKEEAADGEKVCAKVWGAKFDGAGLVDEKPELEKNEDVKESKADAEQVLKETEKPDAAEEKNPADPAVIH